MTDLADFGADVPDPGPDDVDDDRDDGPPPDARRCQALAQTTGERCQGRVTRMGSGSNRFCPAHRDADDVQLADGVDDGH